MGVSRVLLLALAALATTAVAGQDGATAWPVSANSTTTHTISHVVPPQATEEPSAGFPSQDSSASSDTTATEAPALAAELADGSGFGGSGSGGNSSASGSGHDGPDVGDVGDNAAVTVPDVVAKPTFVPVPTQPSAEQQQQQKELEAQEAQAKRAREVAGGQGAGVQAFTIGAGVAGVAAIAVIAVYMHKRRNENERPTIAITSADARDSTPSVYSDPLGTRFSSIVMITPNGDGVCIL